MAVYVVRVDLADNHADGLEGIFSTREKAQQFIEDIRSGKVSWWDRSGRYYIDEWEVDTNTIT